MKLKLKSLFLLLVTLPILFFSCEKEYSQEGNVVAGTSVFTFAGSPGACTNVIVNGTYMPGVALTAEDSVVIFVNVTTVGTYIISTATADGIIFKASGNFTATGTQPVTLMGTGTPTAGTTGTFSFTPGTSGCTFLITVSDSGSGSGSGGTSAFTYDGAPNNCTTAIPAGTYTAGIALMTSNTVTININVATPGTYYITTPEVNGMAFTGIGNFTATGAQTIILTGSGTPTADGNFNFIPSNSGCSFQVTVGTSSPTTDFLQCSIDGTPQTFNVDLSGELVTADTFNISGNQTSATNSNLFGINLTKSTGISTGTYNRYLTTNNTTFCIAGYLDGVTTSTWATGGLPSTTGFSVTVTSFTGSVIQGTFSGTIYSDPLLGTGAKVITNGQFSVTY